MNEPQSSAAPAAARGASPAPPLALGTLLALAALGLAIHLIVARGYGYFRDEFYYLACARHLDWGYVDQPPLSIVLLAGWRAIFGESLLALRALPALAGAATVFVVGRIAQALGGGRFAQGLAALAAVVLPEYLGMQHVYSMNVFDVLIWSLAAWLAVRVLRAGEERLWPVLGVVLGLGLQNKISVLWLGGGLAVGLLLTPARRRLARPGPWIAGGIAALIFLPHVLWQIGHDWPTLEFVRNATRDKMVAVSPAGFALGQVGMLGPVLVPLALAGLAFFLWAPRGRDVRALGWAFVAIAALLIAGGTSRSGYLAAGYTWLLAGGAVLIEPWCARRAWARTAAFVLVALGGVVYAPFAIPVLPVPQYVAYAKWMGEEPSTEEKKEVGRLPQHYADMQGWDRIVAAVAEAWRRLPPEEQAHAAIFAPNYGVAGAIDLLGRRAGLPFAISNHNNYWLWGTRDWDGRVAVVVGSTEERLKARFDSVERAATAECGDCMPYENHRPVWICRGLKTPVAALWAEIKNYD